MEQKNVNRRVRMTKMLIQDALIELLREKPLAKVSVSELCARADVNRTTFYKHYVTQDDVMNEIGERMIADLLHAATPTQKETGRPSLQEQVAGICRHLKAHEDDARFLLTHFTADDAVIKSFVASRITAGQAAYRADIPGCDAGARKMLGEFVVHGMYSLVRCWLLEGTDKSPEDIGALAASIALHGWAEN